MALTDENGGGIPATMLVSPSTFGNGGMGMPYPYPVYGMGGGNNNGFGGDGWWIILLILLIGAGGWGNNGNGGGFFGGGLGTDFPWLMNGQQGINNNISDGFRDAQLHDSVTSVRDGIANLSTQLCSCCGDMQMSVANGFAGTAAAITGAANNLSQQMTANEIASLNRSFAEQTANSQGFNSLQSQLAQCCCDNRLATEQLRYTIATENCADRYEAAQNTRDIIENANRNNQSILDKLCQLELDGKNDRIADLERQLTMANLAASQTAQTALIRDGQTASVNALVNELRSCPIPAQPVYGSQPIFTCPVQVNGNNNGCGCGCGGNF